ITFLLIFGVLLGRDVLGAIRPHEYGAVLEVVVSLSVAVILFEGALTLDLRRIRQVHVCVRRLVTIGLLLTFIASTVAAHLVAGLAVPQAALFGALVTVTGPTVIKPLLRRLHVRRAIATILEGEGILIDPLGAILAIVCLQYALGEGGGAIAAFGLRMGAGIAVGAVVGAAAALVVKHLPRRHAEIKNLIVLACALGCYGAAETLLHEAGIVAVVVAGLVTQRGMEPHERELRAFKEQITTLLISVLFILLAANLQLGAVTGLGWPGLITVLLVMLVVRPLNVLYCTHLRAPNLREQAFLSWTAPRGIVAAAVASLAALKLGKAGISEGATVEALVYLTVFLTVIVQGSTAPLFARLLGITVRDEGGVIVIGANAVGRAVGRLFRDAGRDVVLIDTNPYHCDLAEREDLKGVCGSATDRDTLHHAGILDAGTFIACTESAKANEMAAQVAYADYSVRSVIAAVDSEERPELDPLLEREGVRLAFGRPVPMDTWSGDLTVGIARLDAVPLAAEGIPGKPLGELALPDAVVPIAFTRDGQVELCTAETEFNEEDIVHILSRGVPTEKLCTILVPGKN
ncbi:MAG: cation:proton antiporter, partial [Planctomycetota bacterium]